MSIDMTDGPHIPECPSCKFVFDGQCSMCPSCQVAVPPMERLTFLDQGEYGRAVEVLHGADIDLLRQRPQPGDHIGSIYLGRQSPNWIWIPREQLEDAETALSKVGVSAQFPALPLVGVEEQKCPWCSGTLTYPDDPTCPSCQRAFQWLETPDSRES